jgi:hypothetical protein
MELFPASRFPRAHSLRQQLFRLVPSIRHPSGPNPERRLCAATGQQRSRTSQQWRANHHHLERQPERHSDTHKLTSSRHPRGPNPERRLCAATGQQRRRTSQQWRSNQDRLIVQKTIISLDCPMRLLTLPALRGLQPWRGPGSFSSRSTPPSHASRLVPPRAARRKFKHLRWLSSLPRSQRSHSMQQNRSRL